MNRIVVSPSRVSGLEPGFRTVSAGCQFWLALMRRTTTREIDTLFHMHFSAIRLPTQSAYPRDE
jgi:hypothetical protein